MFLTDFSIFLNVFACFSSQLVEFFSDWGGVDNGFRMIVCVEEIPLRFMKWWEGLVEK